MIVGHTRQIEPRMTHDHGRDPVICFFGRTEGGRQASYQLTVHRNGKKAHIDGPDISADFGSRELTHFLTGVVTKWSGTHHPLVPAAGCSVVS